MILKSLIDFGKFDNNLAENKTNNTLPISEGWNKKPILSHLLELLTTEPNIEVINNKNKITKRNLKECW